MKFVIVAVLTVAVAAIVCLAHGRASRIQSEPGFRDFVKEPDLWNEIIHAREEADLAAEQATLGDAEDLAKQIERYVFGSETRGELWALGRRLKELSPKTNEALLRILKDESNKPKLVELRKGMFLEEAPVMRVCELFDGNMPSDAIELLAPYLSHESAQIRKECSLAIAETGLAEALPTIKQSLADEDEYVRSYALIGMERAHEYNRLSDHVGSEVI